MSLRLMQILVPEVDRLELEGLLEGHEVVSSWQQARSGVELEESLQVPAFDRDRLSGHVGRLA